MGSGQIATNDSTHCRRRIQLIRPTHENLRRLIERNDGVPRCIGQASGVHRNPRLFKYYWWVFHEGVPVEDKEFLWQPEYRLCGYDADLLMARLEREGKTCIVYNQRYPRSDPRNPFDPDRWDWFAPSIDDDEDPEWVGKWEGKGFK
jgi:hypothetical protein